MGKNSDWRQLQFYISSWSKKLADGSSNKPFRFGLLIALSSLHCFPRPSNLEESVAKQVLQFQSLAASSINYVPDFELKLKPRETDDCESKEAFQRLLERIYFWVAKLQLTLENKEKFINVTYRCWKSVCIKDLNKVKAQNFLFSI